MHISEINIYPIKSLKGISVESAVVEERGLQYDRRWMLTTPEGMFLTQREFPRMATLSVWVEEDGSGLGVAADRFGDVFVPLEPDTDKRQQVVIWLNICQGQVYGGALNEWFSDAIGTKCQLVYMPDDSRRNINPLFDRGDEVVSFADGYPLMVLGESSLEDLNTRLDDPLPMNRFRPNLVVEGSTPFAEDDWETVTIGDASFHATKLCARCTITTIDQAKGESTGKEPLKTLAGYRSAKDEIPDRFESMGMQKTDVCFGQNLVVDNPGVTIYIGDEVKAKR